eukprot:37428_1
MTALSWFDTSIVVCYLCCIFFIGIYAWWDNRKLTFTSTMHAESYFLASRSVFWLSVSATLFSSNIGAEHFVGLAGTAASTGIAVGAFEWGAPLLLWIMAYFLSELYISSGVITTPEYLELRFNKEVRIYNALMTLFSYVFVVISATLYAGSVILEVVLNWNLWTSSLTLIFGTAIYVTLGGFKAVVWTENVQTCVLLIGGILVIVFSLYHVGGIRGMRAFYEQQNSNHMHLFRSYKDEEWPWPGIIFGIFCNSYYYWNGQHLIVQRILAAKSPLHAKLGCIVTSILKILPVFMMIIPGMCAVQLYPDEFVDATSSAYDRAFPLMVVNTLPTGVMGIVVAAMLSALMSSLAAVYNSASTIIVNDIYKLRYPNISDSTSVRIGRFGACLFVVFSVLWLPRIANNQTELYIYISQIASYINAPFSVLYLFAHFWNRANVYGAYAALGIGFILGIPRFIFGIVLEDKYCKNIFCTSHFLYFAIFLFVTSSLGMIVASLMTEKPDFDTKVDGLTYWTLQNKKSKQKESIENTSGSFDDNVSDKTHEMDVIRVTTAYTANEYDASLSLLVIPSIQNNESKCWDLMNLSGDEHNPRWKHMANILFTLSFVLNIAMWYWFR